MTMQQQRFLNSSSSPSSILSNHEFRLGSSAAHHCGRAIFSDPCPNCGNSKRRLLTLEAETPSASASALRSSDSSAPARHLPPLQLLSGYDARSGDHEAVVLRCDSGAGEEEAEHCFRKTDQSDLLDELPRNHSRSGEQNDDLAPPGLCIDNNSNDNEEEVRNRAGEDDAERESEMGKDTVTFLHKCPCGNKFQFFVLAKPV
ncbi:hypothetical protein Sjap_012997 [Stephania japonica]|uniref:Uncharacterized protein n=1 Tax=Stephania japonica TaxID=461633 RepID=A0AAP0IXW5_9MAGN